MVAGRVVYENGRVTTVDERALCAEARALFADRQGALAVARDQAAVLLPYYDAMYRKAAEQDIGMNRWVGDAGRPN
jgi:5-methylthioadenosine/S-adenosylhomocysteine deaminase